VNAFVAIGPENDEDLNLMIDHVYGWDCFEIITRRDRISAEAMLDRLDRAGRLLTASGDARSQSIEDWRKAEIHALKPRNAPRSPASAGLLFCR
jgi:hypothetical protein